MNRDEAKNILLLYRQGTADGDDPQVAEALALAEIDLELKDWLVVHCARQFVLREKFRQIAAPAGLKEQIISGRAAPRNIIFWRQDFALAAAAVIVAMVALAPFWLRSQKRDDTLAIYENRMAGVALRGYSMDLTTDDPAQIRAYLAQQHAPSDYTLPAPLEKIAATGCVVQTWQNAKVSMICFRTRGPLPPGAQSNLWLFVVDRDSVKDAPASSSPQFTQVNQLATAVWAQDGKLYFLGTAGDGQAIRKFL